jgi:hypothetical protein
MHRSIAALVLAVAACVADGRTTGSEASSTSGSPAVLQQDIRGEYTVIYVDGAPPVINIKGHEPTITIGAERIHFQSQCIYADWTYKRAGETISTKPYYEPGSAMCARGLAPGETAIQDTISSLETVRRISGGLYLEGGGHRLQLQRKISDAEIASRPVNLSGTWRVAAVDGEELDKPYGITLAADHERIWWEPACSLQYRLYTIEGTRFDTAPVDLSGHAVCDIAVPEQLSRIWSALDVADTIARTPDNRVLISGGGRSVTLHRR